MQQQNLDAYVLQRKVPNLQRARYFPGKLLFYFDYVMFIYKYLYAYTVKYTFCFFFYL